MAGDRAPVSTSAFWERLYASSQDGWELVSVTQLENPMGGKSLVAYLKRPSS